MWRMLVSCALRLQELGAGDLLFYGTLCSSLGVEEISKCKIMVLYSC